MIGFDHPFQLYTYQLRRTVLANISSLVNFPPGNGGHTTIDPDSIKPTSLSRRNCRSASSGFGKPAGTPLSSKKENAFR